MSLQTTLEQYTYQYLLNLALSKVSDTVDTREGSIIYDAIAPACYVLAQVFQEMHSVMQETYILTATGENLENRVIEQGLTRRAATPAVRLATFTLTDGSPATIPLGSRFSSISDTDPLTYVITAVYKDSEGNVVAGSYQATCETAGTKGQEYVGNILPISYLPYLKTATISTTLVPGSDTETDEELRQRYMAKVEVSAFGGNIAQYREMFTELSGIAAVQIYPVWNGGGTVKVSIVDSLYRACTPDFVTSIQTKVDPENELSTPSTGLGLAPMDHKVTVTTPTEVACNISGTVALVSGYTLSQVQESVHAALEAYIAELRKSWGESSPLNQYSVTLYIAQVIRVILSVAGVANITDVKVNDSSSDVAFTENSTTQQLPILGEVTLSAQ